MEESLLKTIAALAYGYLLGSVPLAYVIGRLVKHIDIRKVGSGTVGASNVWYNVGKFWILPLGAFDVFVKGLTPVYLARLLGLGIEVQAVAGLLAVAGHNWPVYLGFKGGRGVAPTVGVLLALARLELAVFIVLATAGWRLTNSAALWVFFGFLSLPLLALYFDRHIAVVGMLTGLLLITVIKRLTSNELKGRGVSLPRLLWNRLLFDRDIQDHEAWVRRNTVPIAVKIPPEQSREQE
ncbi:MAG: glycerol-3-phosphate acyltransferase [Dehalococcoidia bacterium]